MDGPLLVTGATGFFGRHLLARLRKETPGARIWAVGVGPQRPRERVDHFESLDLLDVGAVREFLDRSRPAAVIHMAGRVGGGDLRDQLAVNVVGTDNLYRSLVELADYQEIRVLQVGSAAMYGWVDPHDLPVTEKQPLRPLSDYGISKAMQDLLAGSYQRRHALCIVRARVFNVLGPGQPEHVVPGAFLAQLGDVRGGLRDSINVGNLDTARDFLDVRDACGALIELLQRGTSGQAYNVGSGSAVSVRELLLRLLEVSGIKARIEEEPSRLRRADVPVVTADTTLLHQTVVWRPEISLRSSLEDMWRISRSGNRDCPQ